MAKQQLSFLQNVFNEISLERDFMLWQSSDDGLTEKRIRFLSQFRETRFDPQLGLERNQLAKNLILANAFYDKGCNTFENGDVGKCISILNASLCLAPNDQELLFEIYFLRAKAFQASSSFHEALRDLQQVFDLRKSSIEDSVLQKRLEVFRSCQGAIDPKICQAEAYEKALRSQDAKLVKEIEDSLDAEIGKEGHFTKVANPNVDRKQFSDCVAISESESQGRFTLASRNIKPGELLAIDEPVVSLLDADFSKSHCWHCMKKAKYVIACSRCSGVIFCSTQCRNRSEGTYHKYECGITDVLYQSGIGVWILAFRAIASRPKEFFLEASFKEVRRNPDMRPNTFMEFCQLVTHEGSTLFSAPELMKEALVSVFLTRCLTSRNYFGKDHLNNCEFDSEQISVARWIHSLMRVAKFNSHELTELSPDFSPRDTRLKTRRIGVAVNPSLALINHSCDPNYGRVWTRGPDGALKVLAFATRAILKGEEICDAYSPVFGVARKEERSEIHQRYHFQCCCKACENDWPMLQSVHTNLNKRKQDEKLKKFDKMLKLKEKIMAKGPEEMLRWSIEAVDLSGRIFDPPNPLFYQSEEELHKMLWIVSNAR